MATKRTADESNSDDQVNYASAHEAAADWFAQRTELKKISAEATKSRKTLKATAEALKDMMNREGILHVEVAGRKVRLESACIEA